MRVEVVHARPDGVEVVNLTLPAGATLRDAVTASNMNGAAYGIFGKRATLDTALRDGDRVEIYRALAIDPKEARRRRAAKKKRR